MPYVSFKQRLVVVYLSLRWRKLLLSSGCSSSKLRLDQLPRLSSPTLSCWDTVDSVASLPGELYIHEGYKDRDFDKLCRYFHFQSDDDNALLCPTNGMVW